MANSMKKVVVCGVPFSDNLGDSVIAYCLVGFFNRLCNYSVDVCDLSYRSEIDSNGLKGRNFSFFRSLPRFVRLIFVCCYFTFKFFLKGKKYLTNKIKNADLVVIGGGQLISDVDLNFPLKLYFLVKVAESFNVPIKICSVGVSGKWSYFGRYLMKRVLYSKNINLISARDQLSCDNLAKYFGIVNPVLIPDPALMCSLLIPKVNHKNGRMVVGLGVADLVGLNYSADKFNDLKYNDFNTWASLIKKLNSTGARVVLFTNGALEDEEFLHRKLLSYLEECSLEYEISPRGVSAESLVSIICGFDVVISFRLHANIIAASYSIPYFGVGWDNKVLSFFYSQRRDRCVFKTLADIDISFCDIDFQERISDPSHLTELNYIKYFKD